MTAAFRTHTLRAAVVIALTACGAGAADAGWVSITNGTDHIIVVQGTTDPGTQPRRCKPVRLLPGETVRDFQTATTMKLEVYDAAAPTQPLCTGVYALTPDTQAFSVAKSGRGVVLRQTGRE